MTEIKLPYGRGFYGLDCSKLNILGFLRGQDMPAEREEELLIKENLQNLADCVSSKSKVLIIASDITRRVGTEKFLPLIIERLQNFGLDSGQIKILFSTGLHRPQSQGEHKLLLGKYFGKIEAIDHDCDVDFVDYGTTSFGTEIKLNPLIDWADVIFLTGGINFHYFAGFTGGRKALFPGVASRESILQNHRLIFSQNGRGFHPQVKPGQLQGNPVAEDLQEAADIVSKKKGFYLFNTILNSQGRICKIFSGDYRREFLWACQFFKEKNSVKINRKADLVIASAGGFPYDTNLIQSHKALFHAYQALKQGGCLILLAECSDGITGKGAGTDRRFLEYFDLTLEKMDEIFRQKFDPNCNTAYSIAEKASRSRIILVSRLNPEEVKKTGLRPASSLPEALEISARQSSSENPDTCVMENAATILPVLE
jgi:nickel-dependent lactate racemase